MPVFFLKAANFSRVFQCQANIVQSAYVAILAKRVNIKIKDFTVVKMNLLRRQVHRHLIAVSGINICKQAVNRIFIQHNGEHTVFEAVTEKDIRKARRQYHTNTMIQQCPYSMLTRRPATKIMSRQQDVRALVTRMIQNEIRILFPL